jgi:two-component system NtrC family sensor kinase
VAPLSALGETLGAAAVVFDSHSTPTDEQLRLLSTVAAHTAIVLANARFLDRFREGKEQWESVFNALTDGIALLDEHHVIRRANRALGDLTERSQIELVGEHLCTLLYREGAELHGALARPEASGAPRGAVARSDIMGRVFRVTATAMRGAATPEGWWVALVEDLTEWQAMEAQLIQNERMVAVGQLVSGVAHELNNPLTSIAGLAEFLLTRSEISKTNREHLGVIQEQAERANRIVGNLLTFARKGPRETGTIDVSDLAHRAAMLMAYEMRLRHIELEEQLDSALPSVRGDHYELQQVIVNLLTNAVQAVLHAPEGQRRLVRVRTALEGSMVSMTVTDSGPGISENDLGHIFTPFFTTKDPGRGTGLGLSISFGIVEGHGGRLWVKETGSTGTTFQMDLPISAGGDHEVRGPATRESGAMPSIAQGRRILVIDADNAFQRMIKALFAGGGQTVHTTSTATKISRQFQPHQYDLIIADPRAAASSGETLGNVLVKQWPHLTDRTILVTADVRPETIRWLEQSGFQFFRKPFNVREFLRAAARVFDETDRHKADSRTGGQ